MFKYVVVVAVGLFGSSTLAEEFKPDSGIPTGPTSISGRTIDYQGLIPGISPDELRAWWESTYPGVALTEHTMKFEGSIAGAYVQMTPFINMLESPYGFDSSDITETQASFFFNAWGGGNQLLGYQFSTKYDASALPLYDDVRAALVDKYGEPTSFTDYNGFENLTWAFKDGQPINCKDCGLPLYSSSPYNSKWFEQAHYRVEEFDFALSVDLRRENMSARSTRIENIEVEAMDTKKTREGLDADFAALTGEGERLAAIANAQKESRPATAVKF